MVLCNVVQLAIIETQISLTGYDTGTAQSGSSKWIGKIVLPIYYSKKITFLLLKKLYSLTVRFKGLEN